MNIDPESELYKELASVKSLKREVKKLSKKVDELGLQAFYDQITALDKRISVLEKDMLTTQRLFAVLYTEQCKMRMLDLIAIKFSSSSELYHDAREHIVIQYTKMQTDIKTSLKPIKVALKFSDDCVTYSKEHELGY